MTFDLSRFEQNLLEQTAASAAFQHALCHAEYDKLEELLQCHASSYASGTECVDKVLGYAWLTDVKRMLQNCEWTPVELLAALAEWEVARPSSYHAQVMLAAFWLDRASAIRTEACADQVSGDRWLGAAMAADNACVHALRAISLDAKPCLAFWVLMTCASFLGEPVWLIHLFKGQLTPPPSPPQDPDDHAHWYAGFIHIEALGGALLPYPQQLPQTLPPRAAHEFAEGHVYWLLRAIEVNPWDLATLANAVYFLYPRWGGSHEAMEAFINGPLCKALSEKQRGRLWYTKAMDDIEDYQYDHFDDEYNLDADWQGLLARSKPAWCEVRCLMKYGEYLSYQGRLDVAYRYHAEALQCYAQSGVTVLCEQSDMRNITIDIARDGMPDPQGILAAYLSIAEWQNRSSWHLLLAMVGRQFNMFGMPRVEKDGQLERAVQLLHHQGHAHDDAYDVPMLLWRGGHYQAAFWLASRLADQDLAWAQIFLVDIYLGVLEDNGQNPYATDAELALFWQRKSAALRHPRAQFLLAKRFLLTDGFIVSDPMVMAEARDLLHSALTNGEDEARLWLYRLMIDSGSPEEAHWAHDTFTHELLNHSRRYTRACTAVYLADLYSRENGPVHAPELAVAWARQAMALDEEGEFSQYLQNLIEANTPDSKSLIGVVSRLMRDPSADLKAALNNGRVFVPEGFSL